MLTENDIQIGAWYGTAPRAAALTWEDGPEGVNYIVEGIHTILPMFTSKTAFLDMVNGGKALFDAGNPICPTNVEVINPHAQTQEQRDFIAKVLAMPEDKD